MSSFTRPSSPDRRVTIAGKTSRFGRDVPRSSSGENSTTAWLLSPGGRGRGERAADDELLDLRRSLVDAERTDLARQLLHDHSRDDAKPTVELYCGVDDPERGLRGVHL